MGVTEHFDLGNGEQATFEGRAECIGKEGTIGSPPTVVVLADVDDTRANDEAVHFSKETGAFLKNAIVVDVDGDGHDDIVTLRKDGQTANGDNQEIVQEVVIHYSNGSGRANMSVEVLKDSKYAEAITVGDFNGDHLIDIVIGNPNTTGSNESGITVFRQTSARNFTKLPPLAATVNSIQIKNLATGDFDGDGSLDVVANYFDGRLAIFYGENGNLTFGRQANHGGSRAFADMAVGRINDDHLDDIVIADSSGRSLWVGLGTPKNAGGFVFQSEALATSRVPKSIAIGDVNGDNRLDVVAVGEGEGNLGLGDLYLGNGRGEFDSRITFETGAKPVQGPGINDLRNRPSFVSLGDSNGDKYLDIAIGHEEPGKSGLNYYSNYFYVIDTTWTSDELPPAPGVHAEAFQVGGSQFSPGDQLSFNFDLVNNMPNGGRLSYSVLVSQDPHIDWRNDRVIYYGMTAIGGEETKTITVMPSRLQLSTSSSSMRTQVIALDGPRLPARDDAFWKGSGEYYIGVAIHPFREPASGGARDLLGIDVPNVQLVEPAEYHGDNANQGVGIDIGSFVVSEFKHRVIDVPHTTVHFSTAGTRTLRNSDGTSLTVDANDIVRLDVYGSSRQFSRLLDGDAVGLNRPSGNIDAFTLLDSGQIVVSTSGSTNVTGSRTAGQDLLIFTPTPGYVDRGSWDLLLDGSRFGLTLASENIDAVDVLSNGQVAISTSGVMRTKNFSANDEDIVIYDPQRVGTRREQLWTKKFDGSDVRLTTGSEDVDAISFPNNNQMVFSTGGNAKVSKRQRYDGDDLIQFNATRWGGTTRGSYSLAQDSGTVGLSGVGIDALHVGSGRSAEALKRYFVIPEVSDPALEPPIDILFSQLASPGLDRLDLFNSPVTETQTNGTASIQPIRSLASGDQMVSFPVVAISPAIRSDRFPLEEVSYEPDELFALTEDFLSL